MNIKLFSLLVLTVGLANSGKAQDRNYSNRDYQNRDRDYQQQQNYPDRNRDNRDDRNDDRYDNNRNNNYGNNGNNNNYDVYARCDDGSYGSYSFDRRNPFDTRNPNYDPRNPFDPRPVYDPYRHSRWNEIDFRSNADPFDFCDNRRVWANRYYPVDPRNPYDIRNRYLNRYNGGYARRAPSRPVIVVTVPIFGRGHGHHGRRDW